MNQLEQQALEVVRDLGMSYAIPIRQELDKRNGYTTNAGTLYMTLEKLEKKGLIRSWMGEATKERGGRSKRYYQVIEPDELAEIQTTVLEQQPIEPETQTPEPEIPANGIYIV